MRGRTVRKLSVESRDLIAGSWIGALLGLPWTLSQRVCWRRVNEDFIWQRNFTAHDSTHTRAHTSTLDVARRQRILLPWWDLKWDAREAGATRTVSQPPPPLVAITLTSCWINELLLFECICDLFFLSLEEIRHVHRDTIAWPSAGWDAFEKF